MENPIQMGDLGVPPMSGNLRMNVQDMHFNLRITLWMVLGSLKIEGVQAIHLFLVLFQMFQSQEALPGRRGFPVDRSCGVRIPAVSSP